jgi:hypothetical protein
MNDDQFAKLFNYTATVDKKLDGVVGNTATKEDIRRLESVIDSYAAKLDSYA